MSLGYDRAPLHPRVRSPAPRSRPSCSGSRARRRPSRARAHARGQGASSSTACSPPRRSAPPGTVEARWWTKSSARAPRAKAQARRAPGRDVCREKRQDEFDFEYGEDSRRTSRSSTRLREGARALQPGRQRRNESPPGRAAQALSTGCTSTSRRFLFELLVPAEPAQLAAVGGDADRYDREAAAELMERAIAELQDAGIEPDVWKIEGLGRARGLRAGRRADARAAAATSRLRRARPWRQRGQGHALAATGAGVAGYIGFAVGRTIWWDALKAWLAGEADRETAAARIAGNYQRLVDAYTSAV